MVHGEQYYKVGNRYRELPLNIRLVRNHRILGNRQSVTKFYPLRYGVLPLNGANRYGVLPLNG